MVDLPLRENRTKKSVQKEKKKKTTPLLPQLKKMKVDRFYGGGLAGMRRFNRGGKV